MSPPTSKYRNVPTVIDGIRFASKKEAKRWGELRLLEQAGEIQQLERQVRYSLDVDGQHICNYVCDFRYRELVEGRPFDVNRLVIEDVKSRPTKTREYLIKKALMKAIHNIEIKEI